MQLTLTISDHSSEPRQNRLHTQYGMFSYTLKPGAGGTSGASTRKTFERKKNRTTGHEARNGGAQSKSARRLAYGV